jgi:hypothetical protein
VVVPEIALGPTGAREPRRRVGRLVGAVAVVLALVAGALVVVLTRGGGSAEAQPLALRFTQGQSETYEIHQTMDGTISSDLFGEMPLDMDLTEVMTWTVTSVDGEGNATIELSVDEMSGSVSGTQIPPAVSDIPPVEFVVAPDGRIVSAGGLALGGAAQTEGFGFPGMGQLTPILPDEGEAVSPGDTWEKRFSQEFPYGEGTIEFTATSTYERNESVNGAEAAVIVTHLSVPMDFTMDFQELLDSLGDDLGAAGTTGVAALANATASYTGRGDITQTSFVDLEAKQLLRTESTGDFDITMRFAGFAGFEGSMAFRGSFTQRLERR